MAPNLAHSRHLAQVNFLATFLYQAGNGGGEGPWARAGDSGMKRKHPGDHSHDWGKKVKAGELGACLVTSQPIPVQCSGLQGTQGGLLPTSEPGQALTEGIGLRARLAGSWPEAATSSAGRDESAKGMS